MEWAKLVLPIAECYMSLLLQFPITVQIFVKLLRRYKYLQKVFEEEMRKLVNFLKGFSGDERRRLAIFTAVAILDGVTAKPTMLKVLINEHLTRDGLSLQFVTDVFQVCNNTTLLPLSWYACLQCS